MPSLNTMRDPSEHENRHRIWSAAFSDKALCGYEERMSKYQARLTDHINSTVDNVINVSKSFNYYSFDVMGDLAFGTSFRMLGSSEEHWATKILKNGLEPLGYIFSV